MPRLFVAIAVPEQIDRYFDQQILGNVPVAIQPVKHITLRFIGHVTEQVASTIERDLSNVVSQPFELRVEGCELFKPTSSKPILVASVCQHPQLTDLYQQIGEIVERQGVQLDQRAFKPHITLVRFFSPTPDLIAEVSERAQHIVSQFEVTGFVLYGVDRSLPTPYFKRQQYYFP